MRFITCIKLVAHVLVCVHGITHIKWRRLPVVFFNPLIVVVTKGHTYLEVLVEGLLKYVWHFVTGIKRLKGVLEIFKE